MRALALSVLSLLPGLLSAAALPTPKEQVIAYVFVKDRVIQPGEIAANKLTRINYAFANLQGGRVVEGFAHDRENFAALNELKKQNPQLAVLVSIGGWTWSGNFSDMALTEKSRKAFIESAVQFVERYQLNGLDIDWEYPGMIGDNNKFRPEDKKNYTSLLKELRKRFDREEKKSGKHLFTSVATGASTEFLSHTEMRKVQKYLDTVNLMAYDYYEPEGDKITGHHAPLFTNPSDPKHISADASVHEYEKAGVPADKIVLGVPFYGHVWGEVAAENHGLFQSGRPVPNAFANFGDITGDMLNKGYERFWDSAASAPYLYNSSSRTFVSYEDERSLMLKCRYVNEHKLAGVMFWDYSGDPKGALLDALNAGLHSTESKKVEAH
ncbi:MAG: Chitinase [Bryobacterales bacterium]|nr:Chitinase [Bryobacterales bacterium]